VAFRQNMTMLDVMIQAGGLTDFADGNAAVLVRGAEAGKQYSVRLKDLLKRGDISANVDVKPGDIIIVPQSWF
jgi:polysaccharide export outer membrane protein